MSRVPDRSKSSPIIERPTAGRSADLGAQVEVPSRPDADAEGDDPAPTQHGGHVPPLFAMADDDAEPRPAAPPPQRPLTERISQGRPSYAEPDPHIAGVVGRSATGADRRDT